IIQALRTHYHDPHITLVANPAVLPLALAFGLVEEVSDYGHLQWSQLFLAPPQERGSAPSIVGAPLVGALGLAGALGLVGALERGGNPTSSALPDQLQHTDLAICWLRDPDGMVEQNLLAAGVKRV